MPSFFDIGKSIDDKKAFEIERRNRGFIPATLVDLLVIKSMTSGDDVVDIWMGFLRHIVKQRGANDWAQEDNSTLEDWFESYAMGF